MHYKNVKGILSAQNGMNIYRGCSHGCIYCDSRSACYHMDHDFEDIEVKENAIELLDLALRRKRSKAMIATGSMSDPYIPLETQLEYTRNALKTAKKYGFGFTLITKSDRVLRDIDLLAEINSQSKAVVQMTLTTADDKLRSILEPGVCPTSARFKALQALNRAGIPTVVWLCPILPFINDTRENLQGILDMCIQAKVKGIICFGFGLTLREGNREYFYSRLDRHFPGLKERYISAFGQSYSCQSPHNRRLTKIFHGICRQNGIMHNNDEIFRYLREFPQKNTAEQVSLFDL